MAGFFTWVEHPAAWPRWLLMWLLIAAIYFALKLLTLFAAPLAGAPPWRKWAYLFLWPGMNATQFVVGSHGERCSKITTGEWLEAALNGIAGVVVFTAAHRWLGPSSQLLLGWAGMIGTVLVLHFGVFHLTSCAWRKLGIHARPLMDHPTRATSVAQFWGRRWNTAYRDVTHAFVFRPLSQRWGNSAALVVGFVISGFIHELAISLPAGGGFGGPTAFFTIQVAAILFERTSAGRALGLGRTASGWLFTAAVLILPVQLLFHEAFVLRVVVPFMRALGAA